MKTVEENNGLVEQEVFYLKGVLCLPHYTVAGAYVMPRKCGHDLRYFTREQLISKGAKPGKLMLWPRRQSR